MENITPTYFEKSMEIQGYNNQDQTQDILLQRKISASLRVGNMKPHTGQQENLQSFIKRSDKHPLDMVAKQSSK